MPVIIGIDDGGALPEYTFQETPISIGRLARSDIVVKNSQVSRRHAQIVQEGDRYLIEDLGSTNFVYVNHHRVTRQPLQHGDTFNVGGVADFIFLLQPDQDLAQSIAERIRSNPESSPAAYSMRKTVSELVGELTLLPQSSADVTESRALGGLSSAANEDVEILLSLAYVLNSSLRLDQVFRVLLEKLLAVLKADKGFILLKAPKTLELTVRFGRGRTGDVDATQLTLAPEAMTLARQCVDEGQTQAGTLGNAHALATPLKVRSSFIGAILVERESGVFQRRDRLFYEAVAHQAAIAIDNARLNEELKDRERRLQSAYEDARDQNTRLQIQSEKLDRKVAELSALNAISRGLNMVSTLESVLRLILEKTVELLGVEKGSLLLVNEETDTLEVKVLLGVDQAEPPAKTTKLKVGEGIAGLALRQGVPLAINDGYKNERFKRLLPTDAAIRSLLCVPLVLGNRKIGVINLTNRLTGQGFSEADKELVTTMAAQAAITIENARLYNLAIFDSLTSLYVKSYFHMMLDREINRCRRYGGDLGVVMIDLDEFKKVNDTYGHQVGDLALSRVGQTIRQTLRESDVAARFGGEEFGLILPATDLPGAVRLAERLRVAVESTPVSLKDREVRLTISAGVSAYPASTTEGKTQLVALADKALYEAKSAGRNRVVALPATPPADAAKAERVRGGEKRTES